MVCFGYIIVNTLQKVLKKDDDDDDDNVIKKEAVKILKFKDLIIEIQHMWKVRAKVIPVIKEVTGTISKSLINTRATYQESTKLMNYKKKTKFGNAHILW
jgi:hypothetical protein